MDFDDQSKGDGLIDLQEIEVNNLRDSNQVKSLQENHNETQSQNTAFH